VLQRDRVNRGMILFLACNLFLFISFFFVLTIVFVILGVINPSDGRSESYSQFVFVVYFVLKARAKKCSLFISHVFQHFWILAFVLT